MSVLTFQPSTLLGKRIGEVIPGGSLSISTSAPKKRQLRVRPSARVEASSLQNEADMKNNSDVISTYKPSQFVPIISSNPQFQTILSNYFPRPLLPVYTRLRLATDDGLSTFFVDVANGTSLSPSGETENGVIPCAPIIEAPPVENSGEENGEELKPAPPVAVILTGLESSSTALVTRRIVNAMTRKKFKTFVINYRSCGGDEDKQNTLRLYHAGFTEDLEALLRAIKHAAVQDGYRAPDVVVCGFSLGANVLVNFLGRYGDAAKTRYNVVAGAGACVPFDPQACQLELDHGWKGYVYSRHVIRSMAIKFEEVLSNMAEKDGDIRTKMSSVYDIEAIRNAQRLGLIDDLYISPTFGFANRAEYYRVIDARPKLANVRVPLLIINARDDPFFDHFSGVSLPTQNHIGDAPVLFHLTEHGGHCGFLDREMLMDDPETGYFQREFGRWFEHVLGMKQNL